MKKTPEKKNTISEVLYVIYHKTYKKYYSKSKRAESGFEWSKWEFATVWKGELSRSPCFSTLRAIKEKSHYEDVCVKKFITYEVEDK